MAGDPARFVEHLAQVVRALRDVDGQQGQTWNDEERVFVAHIGGVAFACFHITSVQSLGQLSLPVSS
jgi:hypothetical protein